MIIWSENQNYLFFKHVEDVSRFIYSTKWNSCISAQENLRLNSATTKNSWLSDSATNENNQTNVDSGNSAMTQVPIRRDMAIWYSTIKGYFFKDLIDLEHRMDF